MKKRLLFAILLVLLAFLTKGQPVTITPPSANIQPGESVTLTASGAMYYQWAPATGLSTTEGPVTVASPTVTTTYTCSGYAPGAESVVNGNFDQGNVGFTSAYEYNTNLWNEGTYYVDYDASLHHENFVGQGHNGGNFMIVNGATIPRTNVWTEQIAVNPNTYYAFSTWVCTLAGQANEVALLQFSINDIQIGDVFSAPAYTGTWEQFYELWYSGNSTTATITILNQNTVGSGNDFGLDDISFCELVLVGAPECTVYVGSMSATATADDTELCEGESTTLHALPTGGSGNYSYSWTPANNLNDANLQHPVATPPVGTTTYICHITDNSWGIFQDVSVSIVVHPNEVENLYETICSGEVYNFYGQEVSEPEVYEHHEQTQYGCDKTIYLHLDNWPTYDETPIMAYICSGESYTFYGTEYYTSCNEVYTDHTIHGCDSIVRLNLTVYPANDTLLIDPGICDGDTYNFHGTLYDQDGQIAYFDTIDSHGCLKVEKLVLSVDEYQMPPMVNQYECYAQGTTPAWYWDKTGITYHEDTYDEIILDDPNGGCPIRHRLNLMFHEEFYSEVTVETCSSYFWPITGETYTESQQGITKTIHNSFGDVECDSTYVLNLSIGNYEPHPTEIYPMDSLNTAPHWVVTATEFQINSYDFSVEDINPNCYWDTVTWNFEEPMLWVLEPFGDKGKCCRVFVLNHVDDTIWLDAHAFNQCAPEDGVVQRYWMVCSFYGVEGNDTSIGSASFDIYPNPNNGSMTLNFEGLTGKIDIKVYNMMGVMLDNVQIYNDIEKKLVQYDLMSRAKGIYFFVVNGKEGTLSKKVIVN